MLVKRFQEYGLIISLILFLFSCKHEESAFYNMIRTNDDCMIVCSIKHSNFQTIEVVMEKNRIIGIFDKYDQSVPLESIINSIKEDQPVDVSESLYWEFYTSHVVDQPKIDSLLNNNIDKVIFVNHKNEKILNPNVIPDLTLMEELHIIKRLFNQKILIRRDCESGYYYVLN